MPVMTAPHEAFAEDPHARSAPRPGRAGTAGEGPEKADREEAAGGLDRRADPPLPLRARLQSAVAELPGLPEVDPLERYGIRNLTVLWLEADKSEHTQRAYYADLAGWLDWCVRTGIDPIAARRADVDA